MPENDAVLPTEAQIHPLNQYNAFNIEGIVPLLDRHGRYLYFTISPVYDRTESVTCSGRVKAYVSDGSGSLEGSKISPQGTNSNFY